MANLMLMLLQKVMLFQKLWEMLKPMKTLIKPRFFTTLSKSSMIIAARDNVDRNIRVLISQVLGI